MKLLLILPKSENSFLGGVSKSGRAGLARIALTTIAALTPDDFEVTIKDARVEDISSNTEADLVGITALTSEAPSAYKIADAFRVRGVKVVMGGVHVSAMPDEALQHADSVVIGEAELVWRDLLEDFKKRELKPRYKAKEMVYMKGMVIPKRYLLDYKMYSSFSTLQATRGCPFTCDFCTVTTFFGNKYRCRPVEEVVEEVKKLPDKRVFFLDDNLVGRPKYAKKLMKTLIPLNITWGSQASITLARDEELLSLYAKSGGKYVFIGFESLSQENLEGMRKGWNSTKSYKTAIKKIHKAGIDIIGSFILGLDHDDIFCFKNVLDFIKNTSVDALYLNILTPFPGTDLYKRLEKEGRIFDQDWGKYNTGFVVLQPKLMTADELQNGYNWLNREVYSLPNVLKRIFRSPRNILSRASLNFSYRRKAMRLPKPSVSFLDKIKTSME